MASKTLNTRMRQITGTASTLASKVPYSGEIVYETDTGKLKVGNGTSKVSALSSITAGKTQSAITFTGAVTGTWNGSSAKTVNIHSSTSLSTTVSTLTVSSNSIFTSSGCYLIRYGNVAVLSLTGTIRTGQMLYSGYGKYVNLGVTERHPVVCSMYSTQSSFQVHMNESTPLDMKYRGEEILMFYIEDGYLQIQLKGTGKFSSGGYFQTSGTFII